MNLKAIFKSTLRRRGIRITHRLPGRLRLTVPDLALVPEEFERYLTRVSELLEKLPGVQSVNVNRVTGSVLLHYDPSAISETDLLERLERLAEEGVQKFGERGEMDAHARLSLLEEHLGAVIEKMRIHHAATEKN